MKQSVNYITQLYLKHKLQDNNEIKNRSQVKQREHKNTHYASYRRLVRKLSYKRNKIDSNCLDITGEIVIPPIKQSVNYIIQLKLKHKLQDNNYEIKNSGQVKQREHKNTHYASYRPTCSVLKARPNCNLLTFRSFGNTMAAVS